MGAVIGSVELAQVADDAVHMPGPNAFVGDAQTGGLAQKLREIGARGFVHELDFVLVGLVDFFRAGKGVDPKAGAGWGREREPRAVGRKLGHGASLCAGCFSFRLPASAGLHTGEGGWYLLNDYGYK